MSIADKIRNMSDERLALLIEDIVDCHCHSCPVESTCPINPMYEDRTGCYERILAWIKGDKDCSTFIV